LDRQVIGVRVNERFRRLVGHRHGARLEEPSGLIESVAIVTLQIGGCPHGVGRRPGVDCLGEGLLRGSGAKERCENGARGEAHWFDAIYQMDVRMKDGPFPPAADFLSYKCTTRTTENGFASHSRDS
jgi:hypothetical protein